MLHPLHPKGKDALPAFVKTLRAFQQAAYAVLMAWGDLSVLDGNIIREPDDVGAAASSGYPDGWPCFDEIPRQIGAWVEDVEKKRQALK